MSKATVIIAVSLIVIGLVILLGVLISCDFNFQNLSTAGFQTKTHNLTETVESLFITTNTADVELIYSKDGTCRVECYEQEKQPHAVRLEDGKLVIGVEDRREWYDYLGINFHSPRIKVYLPRTALTAFEADIGTGSLRMPSDFTFESGSATCTTGDIHWTASVSGKLELESTTGDIALSEISAGSLRLSVTTGDIGITSVSCAGDVGLHVTTGDQTLTDLTCANLSGDGSTGDAILSNVIAAGHLSIRRSTGDVELHNCDGESLSLETTTGDITGTLLSPKIYITDVSTGDVNVPKSTEGGLCEITTSTGDVKITHKEPTQ